MATEDGKREMRVKKAGLGGGLTRALELTCRVPNEGRRLGLELLVEVFVLGLPFPRSRVWPLFEAL